METPVPSRRFNRLSFAYIALASSFIAFAMTFTTWWSTAYPEWKARHGYERWLENNCPDYLSGSAFLDDKSAADCKRIPLDEKIKSKTLNE